MAESDLKLRAGAPLRDLGPRGVVLLQKAIFPILLTIALSLVGAGLIFVKRGLWPLALIGGVVGAAAVIIRARPLAWVAVLPLATLAGFVIAGTTFSGGRLFCQEPTLSVGLTSEKAIPAAIARRDIDPDDPVWRFRYASTGTEARAGIPYWIFRVMPRLFPEVFKGGGYERFGFFFDDGAYYERREGDSVDGRFRIPSGLVVVDSELDLPGFHFRVGLKRVALNCAGCHRGQYVGPDGKPVAVDGMPNHTADLQAFKRFFASALVDERFTSAAILAEIDRALAEDGQPPLGPWDRLAYRGIVDLMRRAGQRPTGKWQDARPDNGPGRIDPFNAVKFEVIGAPDDGTVATLDFPSIWNQRPEVRSWHHYDGNTRDSNARNFGSVIGVGGIALSVHKRSVTEVGRWIDGLPPPAWPFAPPPADAVARGKSAYDRLCFGCHGRYDRASNRVEPGPAYMTIDEKVGTDPERWKAFNPEVARALNSFGERRQLWPVDAFRPAKAGYLRGPLDGIWARAPYLHNGSVPTLDDLLRPPAERPKKFCRGRPEYDVARVGFSSRINDATGRCDTGFEYDTALPGNHNDGHVHLPKDDAERADLLAYLRSL